MAKNAEQFAPYDTANYLGEIEDVAAYLEAALEEADDDPALIAQALGTAPNPQRTALVDMVPFFIEQNSDARGIVPNIDRLANVARRVGELVARILPGEATPLPAHVEFLGRAVAEAYRSTPGSTSRGLTIRSAGVLGCV